MMEFASASVILRFTTEATSGVASQITNASPLARAKTAWPGIEVSSATEATENISDNAAAYTINAVVFIRAPSEDVVALSGGCSAWLLRTGLLIAAAIHLEDPWVTTTGGLGRALWAALRGTLPVDATSIDANHRYVDL